MGTTASQLDLAGIKLWSTSRTRRYGLIMKDFIVGKDDFSGFCLLGRFYGIFGKL